MSLDEFKAWRDGYLAAKGKGKLTDKDYAAILAKLDEVHAGPCGCCRPWIIYTTPQISPTITTSPFWSNGSSSNFTLMANAGSTGSSGEAA
jgi:hypothetical protein